MDAGNFATLAIDKEFEPRRDLLFSFYKEQNYDAITLGPQEMNSSLSVWKQASQDGLPIVCANLFEGKRSKKPVFDAYRWTERAGVRMAVVGLIMERSVANSPDSAEVRVESPYKIQKLMRKVLKRSDYVTLIGDFTVKEADSLAQTYPEVNLIVSSNPALSNYFTVGTTVVAPCGAKGYYGEYIETSVARSDSAKYEKVRETLDTKIPADTLYEKRVSQSGILPRK